MAGIIFFRIKIAIVNYNNKHNYNSFYALGRLLVEYYVIIINIQFTLLLRVLGITYLL